MKNSDDDKNSFELKNFEEVFDSELDSINERRRRLSNASKARAKSYESTNSDYAPAVSKETIKQETEAARAKEITEEPDVEAPKGSDHGVSDIAGICISGGGIRSAAFSIGVTQAMDALQATRKPKGQSSPKPASAFEQMDYMSTVSGGGYTAGCISAAMADENAPFPFPSKLEKTEPPVMRHIRDHSNYLFPKGGWCEKLANLASYLRGIFANVPSLLVIVLSAVLLTILLCQNIPSVYVPSVLGYPLADMLNLFTPEFESFNQGFFIVLRLFLGFLVVALVLWALFRSLRQRPHMEFKTFGTRLISGFLALAAVIFLFELQPKMLSGIHAQYCRSIVRSYEPEKEINQDGRPTVQALYNHASCELTGVPDPVKIKENYEKIQAAEAETLDEDGATSGEAKAELEQLEKTQETLKQATLKSANLYEYLLGQIQKIAAFLAAFAAVLGTLRSLKGIGEASAKQSQSGIKGKLRAFGSKLVYSALGLLLPLVLWLCYLYLSFWGLSGVIGKDDLFFCHAPEILTLFNSGNCTAAVAKHYPGMIYIVIALLSFALAIQISTNKNSPHGLYRDSLARAFLVRAAKVAASGADANPVVALDHKMMSETGNGAAPFHLINAALNLQSSQRANGRGRNAGFFTFSQNHTGSFETGYLQTSTMEQLEAEKDGRTFGLSSAVAVSAAAAATAMGSLTMKPFAITLAVLNVRLGYWFKNPKVIARMAIEAGFDAISNGWIKNNFRSSSFVLLIREMFGLMDEERDLVYLSDGGHLENLGLYSLLQRRCRYIIVVDGEADPSLNFSSLAIAQRYARIDLGTRIDLDVNKIREATAAASQEYTGGKKPADMPDPAPLEERPHCAIGLINYPKDDRRREQKGVIFYVKSSITGDENDYIRDYARRNPSFPHETTGDQFFSEEQFEVYRALGFHCAFKALTGYAVVQEGGKTVRLNQKPGSKHPKPSAKVRQIWEEVFAEIEKRYGP